MKTSFLFKALILIPAAAWLLAACMPPLGPPREGNLRILLAGGNGPRAVSAETIAALSYTLDFSGPGGESFSRTAEPGTESLTLSLKLGEWTIQARAYLTGTLFGTGETTINVEAGKLNRTIIYMHTLAVDPLASAKEITAFTIAEPPATGIITGTVIAVTVPYGTDVTGLVPAITHTGAGINPASGAVQDFSSPVAYTVTAADGSTQTYTVTVTVAPASAKEITGFSFDTLIPPVTGIISGTGITVTVPYGTDVTGLVPAITHTGAGIAPASGAAQDFSSPVAYTVTAADGSTQTYTVTVTVAPASAKEITGFRFDTFSPPVTGIISGTGITVTVPYGTIVTNLAPSITVSPGAAVSPASGTARDFSNPVTYTVTAADGSAKTYSVTVTELPPLTLFVAQSGNDAGNGSETAPFATVNKALSVIAAAYAAPDWPGKGTASANPARILVSGTVTGTGGPEGMVEIAETETNPLYTSYPPVILAGREGEEGILDAGGLSRVLYIRNGDVTLGPGLTLTGGDAGPLNPGGGVLLEGGSFTMTGGTISWNEANDASYGQGGGVFAGGGAFTMSGGTISSNSAGHSGNGVCVGGSGSFAMSGGALVAADNDVYLTEGKTITVSGPLTQAVAAKIRPASYIHGMQILTGQTHQAGKFDIGENEYLPYQLDNEGLLRKDWYAAIAQGTGASVFNDIAVDAQGHVYAAGVTVGNTAVNYGNGVTYTGAASGTYANAVLVKYDPQGNALWAQGVVSGNNSSQFLGIVLDSSGNVFVLGIIEGSGAQYNFGLGNVTPVGATATGIIVKYSSGGTPLAQTAPESGSSWAPFYDIGIDSQGNVYVSGMKYGAVDYGNGVVTDNSSVDTAVLVKYNSTLTAQWVKAAGGNGTHCFFGLTVDASDNIYTGGYHNGSSIDFGNGVSLDSGYNAIIVKWDSNGNALWAKKASGSQSGFGKVTAYGGAVYATGDQNGTGSYNYDGASIAGSASKNPVLVKYDASSGAVLWAKTAASGGADGTFGNRVAADETGVCVTGYQTGTNAFNYGNSVTATGASSGNNAVLVKYNAVGDAQYAHTVSVGTSDSEFKGVAMRGDSLYLAGHQKGTGAYTYVTGSGALTGGSTDVNAVVMRYKK